MFNIYVLSLGSSGHTDAVPHIESASRDLAPAGKGCLAAKQANASERVSSLYSLLSRIARGVPLGFPWVSRYAIRIDTQISDHIDIVNPSGKPLCYPATLVAERVPSGPLCYITLGF